MRALLAAISFLTILPVPVSTHRDRRALRASVVYYPLVGMLIGLASVLIIPLGFSGPVLIVLLTVLPLALTRALHVDGLADTCDGLFGGRAPAERLRIMHDPRLGTFGVLAVALDVVARAILVSAIWHTAPAALLAAPLLGRWAMVGALQLAPYGPHGKMKAAVARPGWLGLLAASGWAGAFLLVILLVFRDSFTPLLISTCAAAALTLVWVPFIKQRLGHLSGDTLGALNEGVEILVLIVFVELTA